MKASSRDPARWREQGADRHALEDRAAALVSAAAEVVPLDPTALARIRAAVLAGESPAAVRDFQVVPARARLAWLVALLLLGSAATAGGASVVWRRYLAPGRARVAPAVVDRPVVPPAGRRATRPTARPPLETSAEEAEPPEPPPPPPIQPAAVRARPPRSVAVAIADHAMTADPPAPAESESHLLARALIDLRQTRDARAALAALDEYDRRFPGGTLKAEAASARLEAVIELEDWKTALALLDGTAAFTGPLGADLLLTRAELRAGVDRCGEALPDFTDLLDGRAGPLAKPAGERALYGRAICFGRLRQDARARTDLADYRRRFPGGRFAPEVERLLSGRSAREAP